jgi:ribose transport system substrate-binding protein
MLAKKCTSTFITIMVFIYMTACGSSPVPRQNTTNTGVIKSPNDIHIALLSGAMTNSVVLEAVAGAQYAANQYGVAAQIVTPQVFDADHTKQLFESLVKTAPDGIIMESTLSSIGDDEQLAIKAKIPLISVDQAPPPTSSVSTYILNDHAVGGQMMVDELLKRLPPNAKGSVIIGCNSDPTFAIYAARIQGIKAELQRSRPDLQIIGPLLLPNGVDDWSAVIKAHPDVQICIGVSDLDSVYAATVKQSNKGTFLIGGFNLQDAALQAVANGVITGLVDPQYFLKGYVAMRMMIEHALNGKEILKGWLDLGAALITQDNAQAVIARQMTFEAKGKYFQPAIDKVFANPSAYLK